MTLLNTLENEMVTSVFFTPGDTVNVGSNAFVIDKFGRVSVNQCELNFEINFFVSPTMCCEKKRSF